MAHGPASAVVISAIALSAIAGCGGSGSGGSASHTVSSTPVPSGETGAGAQLNVQPGAASEQTRPTVTPARVHAFTPLVLRIRARRSLGPRYLYRIEITGRFPACRVFTEVAAGRRGQRLRVVLRPRLGLGWCRGLHKGAVLLETLPHCGPAGTACELHPPFKKTGTFRFDAIVPQSSP